MQLNKAEEGQPGVVWTSTGSFRFADSPTVYKRLGEGETRVKFKTCLVCDKTKYGCDGVKGNVKKVQSVCYSELYCLEWEVVYGVRKNDKGELEEYFDAH